MSETIATLGVLVAGFFVTLYFLERTRRIAGEDRELNARFEADQLRAKVDRVLDERDAEHATSEQRLSRIYELLKCRRR